MPSRVQGSSSEEEHNHELTQVGLPTKTKEAVTQLFNNGVTKPNPILKALREMGVTSPKKRKLQSFLTSLRAKQGNI